MALKDEDEFTLALMKLIFGFALMAFRPWVVAVLWRWHVSPLGVPALSYWQAFGLLMLIGLVRYRYEPPVDDAESYVKRLGAAWFAALFCLALGWLAATSTVTP